MCTYNNGSKASYVPQKIHAGKQYRVQVQCRAAYAYKFRREAKDKLEMPLGSPAKK